MTRAAVALLACLALAACQPRESYGPAAPSAAITPDLARALAAETARMIGGTVSSFTPTGSMLPLIDSRTVAVMERLDPRDRLHVGDIVLFDTRGVRVAHRVVDVDTTTGLVATRGTGNMGTDAGWHRPTHRVVALYYTSR